MSEARFVTYKAADGFPARRLLVFAPHPDDEVFGCGASLALSVRSGAEVQVIVVTDGQLGERYSSGEGLSGRRESESERAAEILGYTRPLFWRYLDRSLRYGDNLIRRVMDTISSFQPDLVLAPALSEVHPDHRALSQSVLKAAERIAIEQSAFSAKHWETEGFDLAFFEVGQPLRANCLIDISSMIDLKRRAMQVFESQLKERPYARLFEALNTYRTYTLTESQTHAEAFYVVERNKLSTGEHNLWLVLAAQDTRVDGLAGQSGLSISLIAPSCSPVEVLQSLAWQSYAAIERIVIGDERLIEPSLRPFFTQRSAEEQGWSFAQTIKASQGEWLFFCSGRYSLPWGHLTQLTKCLSEQAFDRLQLFGLVLPAMAFPLSESMLVHRSLIAKLTEHAEADQSLEMLIGGEWPAHCFAIASEAEQEATQRLTPQAGQISATVASLYSERIAHMEPAKDDLGLVEIERLSEPGNRLTAQLVIASMEQQLGDQAQAIDSLRLEAKALQWTINHRTREVDTLTLSVQEKQQELDAVQSDLAQLSAARDLLERELKQSQETRGALEVCLEQTQQSAALLQGHVDQSYAFIRHLENDIGLLRQDLLRSNQDLQKVQADARVQFSIAQSLAGELDMIRRSKAWRVITAYRRLRYVLKHGYRSKPRNRGAQIPPPSANAVLGLRLSGWLRSHVWPRLPQGLRDVIRSHARLLSGQFWMPASPGNLPALRALSAARSKWLQGQATSLAALSVSDRLQAGVLRPQLDVQMILYDSARWMPDWVASLAAQDVSISQINVIVVDHKAGDGSAVAFWKAIDEAQERRGERFASIQVIAQENRGFGAGHNTALRAGGSPWVLVANPDLTFETKSLSTVLGLALADADSVACWELRQKPFEHPKHYDPVSGLSNWCSHACILIRRTAVESIGGWDERLFMYCEDVAMSYRLREAGYFLRYVPQAVVWHHSYGFPTEVKRAQYIGSAVGQIYLRLRFGMSQDALLAGAVMAHRWITAPANWRSELAKRGLAMLMRGVALRLERLRYRPANPVFFPFRGLDFELRRDGALLAARPLSDLRGEDGASWPMVSVITRTYGGEDGKKRLALLKQAAACVAQQTWPSIQWIVAEDAALVDTEQSHSETATAMFLREFARQHPALDVVYLPCMAVGRSAAGNAALSKARGHWIGFLDDDDLLYADHVETLMQAVFDDALKNNAQHALPAVAVYARAFDVPSDIGDPIEEDEPFMHPGHDRSFDPEALLLFNYMPIQAVLFHRRLYEERGGFDSALDYLEDWNLWVRYAQQHRFVFVPKTTSLYRTPRAPAEKQRRQSLLDEAYEPVREKNHALLLALAQPANHQHAVVTKAN